VVGERLGGDVEALVLLGEVGDGEADVGQKAAGQQVDLLGVDELARMAHRILRLAAVVAMDGLDLAAEHAAPVVDPLQGEHPPVAVRGEEGRHGGIAVDLADPDGARLRAQHGRRGNGRRRNGSRPGEQFTAIEFHLRSPHWCKRAIPPEPVIADRPSP
jgi:hypothetical protein